MRFAISFKDGYVRGELVFPFHVCQRLGYLFLNDSVTAAGIFLIWACMVRASM